jgi:hypothetical protein
MGTEHFGRELGQPALKVAGFQLWVHGLESTDPEDYDWLRVTAHCGASGASVWVHGALMTLADIQRFGTECEALYERRGMSANLTPVEPELQVCLEAVDQLGHVRARVEITPDHLNQSHRMDFEIDQSYFPDIVRQCSTIVHQYQMPGSASQGA